jgi:hypothetical protein
LSQCFRHRYRFLDSAIDVGDAPLDLDCPSLVQRRMFVQAGEQKLHKPHALVRIELERVGE